MGMSWNSPVAPLELLTASALNPDSRCTIFSAHGEFLSPHAWWTASLATISGVHAEVAKAMATITSRPPASLHGLRLRRVTSAECSVEVGAGLVTFGCLLVGGSVTRSCTGPGAPGLGRLLPAWSGGRRVD